MMFQEMTDKYPIRLKTLIESNRYALKNITEAQIRNILLSDNPVPGVYLISDSEEGPLYVGRSKNLAQRIGRDHRSLSKNAANLTYMISKLKNISHNKARDYMFENLYVRFINVESEYDRAVFEVYVAMELNTPFNSFLEH